MNDTIKGLDYLRYSYQPIVNIHTGVTFGFEALLRGWEDAGYKSISDVFDTAYNNRNLEKLDSVLRTSAVSGLYSQGKFSTAKLFYNLDNRLLYELEADKDMPKLDISNEIFTSNICFELSEKHEFHSYEKTHKLLKKFKELHFRIAIDDFGSGYSGLTLLYHSEPDYIKIDRFFIANINDDSRKKFFVANIVNLAHMMGISVIAEGIETEGEFYVCREIGCDYVQGYLVCRPDTNVPSLKLRYEIVDKLVNRHSRQAAGDRDFIKKEIEELEPLSIDTSTSDILEMFRTEQDVRSFPVVNHAYEPMGLLRESDLKRYVFSPYGISILQHKSSSEGIESLIARAPVMEISNPIEKILELYSLNHNLESVIITDDGKYLGILDSSAILRILSEKKISIAQDQNPLTKLPGNSSINGYLAETIKSDCCEHIFAYYDIDNFKPFNDVYGFRQGDRIIRLFSEILQEHRQVSKEFIGHIGGDDFFIGYNEREHSHEVIINEIQEIIQRFSNDVLPFYKESHREQGFISSKSRSGRKNDYPLLTISAAVIRLAPDAADISVEQLSEKIAALKVKAKKSPDHIAVTNLSAWSVL